MSPPTEQLIRDYLNRLSVAARGQLGPDDRRALVSRTRDFIERKTGFAGPPAAIEVARLLAGLGDPAGLVDQERQRLAAVRGETPELTAGRSRMPKVLRRQPGKIRGASWHWPVQEPGRADLRLSLLDGGAATDSSSAAGESRPPSQAPNSPAPNSPAPNGEVPNGVPDGSRPTGATPDQSRPTGATPEGPGPNGAGPSGAAAGLGAAAGPDSGDAVRDGSEPAGGAGTAPLGSAEPAESDWFSRLSSPAPYAPPLSSTEPAPTSADQVSESGPPGTVKSGGQAKPRWPAVVASGASQNGTTQFADSSSVAAGEAPDQPDQAPAWQLMTAKKSAIARSARRLAAAILAWARSRPLEATAVVLLGLGGGIYPPVWLVGAIVALASRAWNYRDKWLGLAGPLLLTVIGTAVGVAAGGRSIGHDMHEGWMFAVVISRIAAVLSAIYLGWRTAHARRAPPVPPWSKPHKVG